MNAEPSPRDECQGDTGPKKKRTSAGSIKERRTKPKNPTPKEPGSDDWGPRLIEEQMRYVEETFM